MKVTRLIASAAVLMTVAAVCGQDNPPFELPGVPNFGQPSGGSGDSSDRVRVTVKALADEVAQGSDLPVAIVFDMDPRWHIWTNQRPTPPGMASFEFAIHTEIEVTTPADGPLVPHTEFIQSQALPWAPSPYGGRFAGTEVKMLSRDEATGAASLLVKYPSGFTRDEAEYLAAALDDLGLDAAGPEPDTDRSPPAAPVRPLPRRRLVR